MVTIFLFPLPFSHFLCLWLSPLFSFSSPFPSLFLSFLVPSLSPSSCEAKSQVCLWLQWRIKACISGPEISFQDWCINHPITELAEFVSDPSFLLHYWIFFSGPTTAGRRFFSASFYSECCCSPWISAWSLLYGEDIHLVYVIPQGPKI